MPSTVRHSAHERDTPPELVIVDIAPSPAGGTLRLGLEVALRLTDLNALDGSGLWFETALTM
ncbi:MAG: hypothetical protein HY323_05575 [Betaproteobacteria bacterium]|nr:hypothetical protein [Betaproteobacteria bacterium]